VHRYLRAIGFNKINKREELQMLINEVVESTIVKRPLPVGYIVSKDIASDENGKVYAELSVDFAPSAGICVRGEFDENSTFLYEYYFPYLRGNNISSYEDITVERHAEKESYAGVCDDMKVGVSLIFYLNNMIPYKRLDSQKKLPIQGTYLKLSALSIDGTIMMPIIKNEYDKQKIKKASKERNNLIAQARMGDEDAIESLTLDDMDTYSIISKKIQEADVYSLVDTYFMPYGVECDQYSILGEIREVHINSNRLTGEEIVFMTLECNELIFDVAINKIDLFGEPAVGRRFKGVIWLQGVIEYPV
jgi:ArsR family metal-binding transcriptional regulator